MDRAHVTRAAHNNACWCDALCRAHGIRGRFDDTAWTSTSRTPPLHPDAITLVPEVDVIALLVRIDSSTGCRVKDSFADLDLARSGFDVIVESEWIRRRPGAPNGPVSGDSEWLPVTSAELPAWERAWASDGEPTGLFRPSLLDAVTVLGRPSADNWDAGAIVNVTDGHVGVSNLFGPADGVDRVWRECVSIIDRLHPGRPVVGYESGGMLAAARGQGFEAIGPLRVWQR